MVTFTAHLSVIIKRSTRYKHKVVCSARGGGGGEDTRSGTEKRCSHNLQSGHPAWWSADNYSIFPTVNILEARIQGGPVRRNVGGQNYNTIQEKEYALQHGGRYKSHYFVEKSKCHKMSLLNAFPLKFRG